MKKVAFKVLGCKVNTYEVEAVYEEFKNAGYEKVSEKEVADVYVINTCSVTNTGDKKSRQAIRKCIRLNPDAIIVVMGCYSQLQTKDVQDIEGVDIILGTQGRENLMDYIKEYEKERKRIVKVDDIMKQKNFEDIATYKYENKTRAFLKIQEGCNNFCTFCIIPWARGLMRSQDPKKVIKQVEELVSQGVKEVVLTGIHTGGYGEDFENYDFSDLLIDLEKIDGLKRIRISSIEITQLDEKFINVFKNSHKIVNHLHVPIQAGSDEILKLMRRNYNLLEFKEKIDELRTVFNDISLTTDIIVGFPQETDELFNKTIETVKEVGFSDLHIFPYSKRNGTIAAKMEGQIPEEEKKRRVNVLMDVAKEQNFNYNKQFVDDILDVLIERKNKDGYYEGYTSNYIKVIVDEEDLELGEIYNVLIKEVNEKNVIGKIIR